MKEGMLRTDNTGKKVTSKKHAAVIRWSKARKNWAKEMAKKG